MPYNLREDGRIAGRQEDGFALIALVVAIFLILLVLGVAAPRVARELRRDREVESMHRANQYVRGVQLFYRRFGQYPSTIDQMEKTNNIRFLRQKYPDPMTGKQDWRLIHLGEAKTTVKGFFGQPLAGLNTQSIGTGIGGATTVGGSGSGGTGSTGFGGSSAGGSSFGGSSGVGVGGGGFTLGNGAGTSTGAGAGAGSGAGSGSGSNGGVASQSATQFKGGGAPIVGFGSSASGTSILEPNEQATYETWEFLYDPRIEQLKTRASLFGGGVSATSATSFGAPGSSSGSAFGAPGSSSSPGSPNAPTSTSPAAPTTPP